MFRRQRTFRISWTSKLCRSCNLINEKRVETQTPNRTMGNSRSYSASWPKHKTTWSVRSTSTRSKSKSWRTTCKPWIPYAPPWNARIKRPSTSSLPNQKIRLPKFQTHWARVSSTTSRSSNSSSSWSNCTSRKACRCSRSQVDRLKARETTQSLTTLTSLLARALSDRSKIKVVPLNYLINGTVWS